MTTVLLYPNLNCPVGCLYCFGKPTKVSNYNKEKMLEQAKNLVQQERIATRHNPDVCLHGGEFCLLPINDMEYFVKGLDEIGIAPAIQTSLMGLTQDHINLFKEYQVHVGISVDGPPELNILRGPRDPDKNKKYQEDIVNNIKILKDNKITFGSISILSRANATPDKIKKLIDWNLETCSSGRFNAMWFPNYKDTSSPLKDWVLSTEELKSAWIELIKVCLENKNAEFLPVREWIDNLFGFNVASCGYSRCDYITTTCRNILPDGEIGRCDRTLQDGVTYIAPKATHMRSNMLKQTDCKGCKYFDICNGGCPAEAGGDWRDKTVFCEAIYAAYEFLENKIRAMIPNIKLSVDVPEYFETYHKTSTAFPWNKHLGSSTWRNSSRVAEEFSCNEQGQLVIESDRHIDHFDMAGRGTARIPQGEYKTKDGEKYYHIDSMKHSDHMDNSGDSCSCRREQV